MTSLDNTNQNVLGLVALIVSVVALLTTCLQVLQQYFSSAEGYRRCAESVMGPWSKGTKRKLNLKEIRVEVVFETPVIFIAPPDNKRGPIENRPIHYMDGTPESYAESRVLEPIAQSQKNKETIKQVHTADDERASWVTLLSSLEMNEHDSREWDKNFCLKKPPKGKATKNPEYELAVALQVKTRSWDFVPSSITRPYATSAICHLVEMMALLGMYWKVFDQIQWNLRAEGNGFILTSTTVHGLGVMVTFSVTGRSSFEENRVIPSNHIKDLCFGTVPNIFEDDDYLGKNPESQNVTLEFGSPGDVDKTLESLGCTPEILRRYRKDHKHIFSVSFELIGMLGKVVRLRGSNFRMIPNPTQDFWLKKIGKKPSWNIITLMEIFQDELEKLSKREDYNELHAIGAVNKQLKDIISLICGNDEEPVTCSRENKIRNRQSEYDLTIEARERIHDALDDRTRFLLDLKQQTILKVVVAHISLVTKVLENPISPLNSIVAVHKEEPLLNYYFDRILPQITTRDTDSHLLDRNEREERNIIWVSLMFRMLCWFLLHDWNKDDKCGVPPDLKGSRMPVYVG
ncbi:37b8fa0f-1443-4b7a-ac19-38ea7d2d8aec [Sclerotinia trifoliorum]|uniref:37b8fa0f-1443-4b7a-ac19-38ea7d2d8aec n=1 Tax=Sclerotinia trifoliorum TaxID=28548 RepID=A0A8H2VYQ5_9HELO|nr:37b8fa0f-1443-4b7a-ac19-38ea7d2d8aec [Sclerotinia trifoliorum]